jgi:hypothetical protein
MGMKEQDQDGHVTDITGIAGLYDAATRGLPGTPPSALYMRHPPKKGGL